MIKTRIVVIALFLAAAPAVAEELYRWVDKDGKVHFGDRPPAEAKSEDIGDELRPLNTTDAAKSRQHAGTKRRIDPHKEYRDKKRRRESKRQQQYQQQMTLACREARKSLRKLRGPVAIFDENGKEIRMTERERQQEAERLQREISRVCG